MCAWYPSGPEEGVRPSGTVVTNSCEPQCECWEPNPGPLQEQQELFPSELCSLSPLFVALCGPSFIRSIPFSLQVNVLQCI